MRPITYEELLQGINQDKTINVFDVERVVEQIINNRFIDEYEEFEDLDYSNTPRRKLKDLARFLKTMRLRY